LRRLATDFLKYCDWQDGDIKAHRQNLAWIIKGFCDLESIRFLTRDHVVHRRDWLKPGNEHLLQRDLEDEITIAARRYYNPILNNDGSPKGWIVS